MEDRQFCHLFHCCPISNPCGSTNNWELKWGGKNTTPHKGSIHLKQLVTVLNTSLFLLREHFTKATDSPRPVTNRNYYEGEEGLGQGHQGSLGTSQTQNLNLFVLFLLWPLDLSGLSKSWAAGVCMW